VQRIFAALERHYPEADTELAYRTPFELLVATILSAQSTDARVNMVTPALFARYPDARALARAEPSDIEPLIMSTGFFRQKAKALVGLARALVARHEGEVPASLEMLTELPGVGRKTANVVLGHAFGVPAFPVDRHVLRVANRLGLVASTDPDKVEAALCRLLPPSQWTAASDRLILHGRRICRPRPLCERCLARDDCDFFRAATARRPGPAFATPTQVPSPRGRARAAPMPAATGKPGRARRQESHGKGAARRPRPAAGRSRTKTRR
jgi:endonuclease-3